MTIQAVISWYHIMIKQMICCSNKSLLKPPCRRLEWFMSCDWNGAQRGGRAGGGVGRWLKVYFLLILWPVATFELFAFLNTQYKMICFALQRWSVDIYFPKNVSIWSLGRCECFFYYMQFKELKCLHSYLMTFPWWIHDSHPITGAGIGSTPRTVSIFVLLKWNKVQKNAAFFISII